MVEEARRKAYDEALARRCAAVAHHCTPAVDLTANRLIRRPPGCGPSRHAAIRWSVNCVDP